MSNIHPFKLAKFILYYFPFYFIWCFQASAKVTDSEFIHFMEKGEKYKYEAFDSAKVYIEKAESRAIHLNDPRGFHSWIIFAHY
jgi:hypothetical protein